ncbi:hypothetical protein [Campylobacter molothri]|uniref:hypothetical protein n=1 Tax=Campylobacter molothri TaxID=1032242 RepID=UPI0039F1793C
MLEFVFSKDIKTKMKNLNNAMILYRYSKNKSELKNLKEEDYKKAKNIIQYKWNSICKTILEEFFDNFEQMEIKISDIIFLLIK